MESAHTNVRVVLGRRIVQLIGSLLSYCKPAALLAFRIQIRLTSAFPQHCSFLYRGGWNESIVAQLYFSCLCESICRVGTVVCTTFNRLISLGRVCPVFITLFK